MSSYGRKRLTITKHLLAKLQQLSRRRTEPPQEENSVLTKKYLDSDLCTGSHDSVISEVSESTTVTNDTRVRDFGDLPSCSKNISVNDNCNFFVTDNQQPNGEIVRNFTGSERETSSSRVDGLSTYKDNLRDMLNKQLFSLRNMKKSNDYLTDFKKTSIPFQNLNERDAFNKSAFVSDALEDFLKNNAELKVSYPIPKLEAEEGVSKKFSLRDDRANKTSKARQQRVPRLIKVKTLAELRKYYEQLPATKRQSVRSLFDNRKNKSLDNPEVQVDCRTKENQENFLDPLMPPIVEQEQIYNGRSPPSSTGVKLNIKIKQKENSPGIWEIVNDINTHFRIKETENRIAKEDQILEPHQQSMESCPKSTIHNRTKESEDIECSKPYCKLGCVCKSVFYESIFPDHCQSVECMFGCTCFSPNFTNFSESSDSYLANTDTFVEDQPKLRRSIKYTDCADVDDMPLNKNKLEVKQFDVLLQKPELDDLSSYCLVDKNGNTIPRMTSQDDFLQDHRTRTSKVASKSKKKKKDIKLCEDSLRLFEERHTCLDEVNEASSSPSQYSWNKREEEFEVQQPKKKIKTNVYNTPSSTSSAEVPLSNSFLETIDLSPDNAPFESELKRHFQDNQKILNIMEKKNIQFRLLSWNKLMEDYNSGKMCIWTKENNPTTLVCSSTRHSPPEGYIDIQKTVHRIELVNYILHDSLPKLTKDLMNLIVVPKKNHISIVGYCLKKPEEMVSQEKSEENDISGDVKFMYNVSAHERDLGSKSKEKVDQKYIHGGGPFSLKTFQRKDHQGLNSFEEFLPTLKRMLPFSHVEDSGGPKRVRLETHSSANDEVEQLQNASVCEADLRLKVPQGKNFFEEVEIYVDESRKGGQRLEENIKHNVAEDSAKILDSSVPESVGKFNRQEDPRDITTEEESSVSESDIKAKDVQVSQVLTSGKRLRCTHTDMNNKSNALILTSRVCVSRKLICNQLKAIEITVPLPEVTKSLRWRMIYLTSDVAYLRFTKSNYSIKGVDLLDVVKVSKKIKSTVTLRNGKFSKYYKHPLFGIFCVPDFQDRVLVGPYLLMEMACIETLAYWSNELIDIRSYNRMTGKVVDDEKPRWLYESYVSTAGLTRNNVIDLTNDLKEDTDNNVTLRLDDYHASAVSLPESGVIDLTREGASNDNPIISLDDSLEDLHVFEK